MAHSSEQSQRSAEPDDRDEESGKSSSDEQGGKSSGKEETSPWEWVIAGFSALLVLSVIGFMLYQAFTQPSTPPNITIEQGEISRSGPGYLVQFHARNRGYTTAQGLMVEGELKMGNETVETSQANLDYVPATGTRTGGLFFRNDPAQYQLNLRPTGYEVP